MLELGAEVISSPASDILYVGLYLSRNKLPAVCCRASMLSQERKFLRRSGLVWQRKQNWSIPAVYIAATIITPQDTYLLLNP